MKKTVQQLNIDGKTISLHAKYVTPPQEIKNIPDNIKSYLQNPTTIAENFDIPKLRIPDLKLLECQGGTAGHLMMFYNLTRQTIAKKVLEIGLGGGLSTFSFLKALQDNQGTLVSLDHKPNENVIGKVNHLGFKKNWQLIMGDSNDFGIIEQTKAAGPYDILLIDGGHTYECCYRDYKNYAPFVKLGGYILIHDTITKTGVLDFIDELETKGHYGCNFAFSQGLYVLRKTTDNIW